MFQRGQGLLLFDKAFLWMCRETSRSKRSNCLLHFWFARGLWLQHSHNSNQLHNGGKRERNSTGLNEAGMKAALDSQQRGEVLSPTWQRQQGRWGEVDGGRYVKWQTPGEPPAGGVIKLRAALLQSARREINLWPSASFFSNRPGRRPSLWEVISQCIHVVKSQYRPSVPFQHGSPPPLLSLEVALIQPPRSIRHWWKRRLKLYLSFRFIRHGAVEFQRRAAELKKHLPAFFSNYRRSVQAAKL